MWSSDVDSTPAHRPDNCARTVAGRGTLLGREQQSHAALSRTASDTVLAAFTPWCEHELCTSLRKLQAGRTPRRAPTQHAKNSKNRITFSLKTCAGGQADSALVASHNAHSNRLRTRRNFRANQTRGRTFVSAIALTLNLCVEVVVN